MEKSAVGLKPFQECYLLDPKKERDAKSNNMGKAMENPRASYRGRNLVSLRKSSPPLPG